MTRGIQSDAEALMKILENENSSNSRVLIKVDASLIKFLHQHLDGKIAAIDQQISSYENNRIRLQSEIVSINNQISDVENNTIRKKKIEQSDLMIAGLLVNITHYQESLKKTQLTTSYENTQRSIRDFKERIELETKYQNEIDELYKKAIDKLEKRRKELEALIRKNNEDEKTEINKLEKEKKELQDLVRKYHDVIMKILLKQAE